MLRLALSLAALPLGAYAASGAKLADTDSAKGLEPIQLTSLSGGLSKRQDDGAPKFFYETLRPGINFAVGTPDQTISLRLFPPNCDSAVVQEDCQKAGTFKMEDSSTYQTYSASYPFNDETQSAKIDYFSDNGNAFGVKLTGQTFGLAEKSVGMSVGVYALAPSAHGGRNPKDSVFDSILAARPDLSRQVAISYNMLQGAGYIQIGAYEANRYQGDATVQPMIDAPGADEGSYRLINLEGVSVTRPDGSKSDVSGAEGHQVRLDWDTSTSFVSTDILNGLLAAFPGAQRTFAGTYPLPEFPTVAPEGYVHFLFAGVTIDVPYISFVVDSASGCKLDVSDYGSHPANINGNSRGLTFLDSVFALYDWNVRAIYLANKSECQKALNCTAAPVTTSAGPTSTAVSTSAGPTETEVTTTAAVTSTAAVASSGSTTEAPVTTSAVITDVTTTHGWHNTTSAPTLTSTYTTATVYTITSCPPATTEIITTFTTYCPATNDHHKPTSMPGNHGDNGNNGSNNNGNNGSDNNGNNRSDNNGNNGNNGADCTTCDSSMPTGNQGGMSTMVKPTGPCPTCDTQATPSVLTAGAAEMFRAPVAAT